MSLPVEGFGSPGEAGWSLQILDAFQVPDGSVIAAQVVVVRKPPISGRGSGQPRTPSSSPRRGGGDKAKPKSEQGQ